MKHPHVKNDFRASNDAVEIRWFVQVAPQSDDSPWNVEIRWFAGSSRVSCQIANHMPSASTPIAGKNWSRGAAESFDVCSEMSAPEIVRFALFGEINASRPRVAS